MHAQRDLLEVQQHLDHVLLDAIDAGVLVQHAFDFNFCDGSARHGRQQHTTKRVAQRVTKAAFEGLDHHARLTRRNGLHLDDTRLEEFGYCLHVTTLTSNTTRRPGSR